jgi:glucokinase
MALALAVDIGGTKLAAALVDSDGGVRALSRATVPTPRPERPDSADGVGAEVVWGALATLVDKVVDRSAWEIDVCGVGCGGPMDRGGEHVSPLNIPAWRGFPLRARLAELLGGDLRVAVDNDAKALALGEGWVGAARGVRDYVAMVVSTGVGGGIVLEGRLLDGALGNAGHIGHLIVEPDGRTCPCGARGCLEAETSGPSLRAVLGHDPSSAPLEVRERTGRLVGRAVASVANLLDLRLAVVAGSVALGFGEPFFAAAQAELDVCARLDFSAGARIVPAGLGADGPLVGAAAVGFRATGVDIGIA